jgi:HAD superfamily phosphoserine phosphatase-like hydrolase
MSNIKLVSFDLDGTLTKIPVFRYIMGKIGFEDKVEYYNKLYDFNSKERINAIHNLAIGMFVDDIIHYLDEIPKVDNIDETVRKLKSYGMEVVILSDNPNYLKKYFERFGFNDFIGSESKVEEGKIVGEAKSLNNKLEVLLEYCNKKGYELNECIHVGDNVNDIVVFEKVFGIAFNPKNEETAKSARYCIYSDDLYDVVKIIEQILINNK